MAGFFKPLELAPSVKRLPKTPRCGECGLFRKCKSPKMAVDGEGRREILVVGEAPGSDEDDQGRPFVGDSGKLAEKVLRKVGLDFRRDCWITNACICRPPNNELPAAAVEHCRPHLVSVVERLRPRTVILLGGSAIESLIGWLWKEDVGAVGRWTGWKIPSRRINAWVCATWHPSWVLREGGEGTTAHLWFARHLKAAVKLKGRPHEQGEPDPFSQVKIEQSPAAAAAWLEERAGEEGMIAFDYETLTLKPDSREARILSCAVSDGRKTLAYPWAEPAISATWKLLATDRPKVGTNIKFEARWTRRFKAKVRNWRWDTMLAAHAMDSRPGICSLKFQAFVQLGVESWDGEVKPFMSGGGSNSPNNLREVPWPKLLRYNAIDALMEWQLARKQMKLMGVEV